MRTIYVLSLTLAMSASALAAGGGSSSGSNGGSNDKGGGHSSSNSSTHSRSSTSTHTVKTCKYGRVYNKRTKSCVSKASRTVPKPEILAQAWVLAKSGRFAEGRDLFSVVAESEPGSAEALNGLGYTNRKLGRFDVAFSYYNQALSIDPNYLDSREYLGEGYAITGRIALAKLQLAEIAQRGGTGTEQYKDLSIAINQAARTAAK